MVDAIQRIRSCLDDLDQQREAVARDHEQSARQLAEIDQQIEHIVQSLPSKATPPTVASPARQTHPSLMGSITRGETHRIRPMEYRDLTQEEAVMRILADLGPCNNRQMNEAWKAAGIKGRPAHAMSTLAKRNKILREPNPNRHGSIFTLA